MFSEGEKIWIKITFQKKILQHAFFFLKQSLHSFKTFDLRAMTQQHTLSCSVEGEQRKVRPAALTMKDCRVFQCLAVWESFLLSQRAQPAAEQSPGQGSPWNGCGQRLPQAAGCVNAAGLKTWADWTCDHWCKPTFPCDQNERDAASLTPPFDWDPSHPRCFWASTVHWAFCLPLSSCFCNCWSVKRSHVIVLFDSVLESFKLNERIHTKKKKNKAAKVHSGGRKSFFFTNTWVTDRKF